jgi:YwqJ-like deaminase
VKLLQLIGRETISAVTLGVYDLAMLLKAFFVRLAKAAAGCFEAMYQFFKRLINGFFEVAESVFEDITEWLLQRYKMAKATIEMCRELGLVILRNISDNLSGGQQLAVADMRYAIEYRGQRLLEGTEDTIVAFSKKLDDIRKSKGTNGARNWLDDVALDRRSVLRLSKKAEKLLDELVASALKRWPDPKKRPGAAGVLEGNLNGKQMQVVAYSAKGISKGKRLEMTHKLVREWLNGAPESLKSRLTHGRCAENFTVSEWLFLAEKALGMKRNSMTIENAREVLEGVASLVKRIHNDKADKLVHGLNKSACDSCNPMLKYFNITEVFY